MKNVDHAVLFFKLREILAKHEPFLKVIVDDEGYYRLFTPTNRPFIGIKVQKKHVGIYVLPVYYNPEPDWKHVQSPSGQVHFRFQT